jgi:hypothetical protein
MTNIARPVPDGGGAAEVVCIGESRFGIVWNGHLRREEYPTQRFALLALAALRRASSSDDVRRFRDGRHPWRK